MNIMKLPEPDQFQFFFDLDVESMQGFIFAVAPTRLAKKYKSDLEDLSQLTKTYNGKSFGLPDSVSVFTDTPDIVGMVLSDHAIKFITDNQDHLDLVHYSDFFMGEPSWDPAEGTTELAHQNPANRSGALFVRLKVQPGVADAFDANQALVASLDFLDTVSKVRLTAQVKRDNTRKRELFIESYSKEDPREIELKAQERKLEQRRLDKAKYEAMDESNPARVAYEKKMEKKNKSKKQKMGMKMVR